MSNKITTPYDRVLIDPNEPLILPDGTAITGRLETFLYALCCLDYDNIPTPLSRIEEFANALITGEIPNIEPQSRSEQFFLAILDGNIDNLPEPQSRSEVLLNKLAVGDFDLTNVDPIQSRYELLLAYLIKNGGVGNLDYVLYEFYQATQTLYNTQEKPVKSAILKGNTLVNLITNSSSNEIININKQSDGFIVKSLNAESKINYLMPTFELSTQYTLVFNSSHDFKLYIGYDSFSYNDWRSFDVKKGINKITLNSLSTNPYSNRNLLFRLVPTELIEITELMLLKGDYTNQDIPYFEGMQSVKMPVLTTTGKNLFNMNNCYASPYNYRQNWGELEQLSPYEYKLTPNQIGNDYGMSIGQNVSLKKGVAYTVSFEYGDNNVSRFNYFNAHYTDGDDSTIKAWSEGLPKTFTFTPTKDIDYVWFCMVWGTKEIVIVKNIQIEQSSQVTPFEPHKSNILSTPEEVVLRSLPNGVCDTLNLNTGEYVQRIEEHVLDGTTNNASRDWNICWNGYSTNTLAFEGYIPTKKLINNNDSTTTTIPKNFICDKVKVLGFGSMWQNGQTVDRELSITTYTGGQLIFVIEKSKLTTMNVSGFKQWLSQNPVTIQYELETPIVKTVDLSVIDQDGNVLPKIKTFNNITHVNVSSDGILPKVEMEVATYNEEDIANANVMTASMDEIYSVQNELDNTNSIQSEEIDSTMIASTEIYENIL